MTIIFQISRYWDENAKDFTDQSNGNINIRRLIDILSTPKGDGYVMIEEKKNEIHVKQYTFNQSTHEINISTTKTFLFRYRYNTFIRRKQLNLVSSSDSDTIRRSHSFNNLHGIKISAAFISDNVWFMFAQEYCLRVTLFIDKWVDMPQIVKLRDLIKCDNEDVQTSTDITSMTESTSREVKTGKKGPNILIIIIIIILALMVVAIALLVCVVICVRMTNKSNNELPQTKSSISHLPASDSIISIKSEEA